MQTAILGFFGVGLAAVLAEMMVPGEGSKDTRQALHTLLALAVLLLLLRPLFGALRGEYAFSFEGLTEGESEETLVLRYEELLQQAVSLGSEEQLKEGLRALLREKYGIAEENAAITVQFRQNGELLRVEIILSGAALLTDPHALGAELADRLQCEVEVR